MVSHYLDFADYIYLLGMLSNVLPYRLFSADWWLYLKIWSDSGFGVWEEEQDYLTSEVKFFYP